MDGRLGGREPVAQPATSKEKGVAHVEAPTLVVDGSVSDGGDDGG
jgi:hypothetical protein